TLDAPKLVEPAISRSNIVDEIFGQLPQGRWVNIVGEPGAGKTQLSVLTSKRTDADVLWINLRGYNPGEACNVIDASIETASGTRFDPPLQGWYRDALPNLGHGKLIVINDVRRVVSVRALLHRSDPLSASCEHHAPL